MMRINTLPGDTAGLLYNFGAEGFPNHRSPTLYDMTFS